MPNTNKNARPNGCAYFCVLILCVPQCDARDNLSYPMPFHRQHTAQTYCLLFQTHITNAALCSCWAVYQYLNIMRICQTEMIFVLGRLNTHIIGSAHRGHRDEGARRKYSTGIHWQTYTQTRVLPVLHAPRSSKRARNEARTPASGNVNIAQLCACRSEGVLLRSVERCACGWISCGCLCCLCGEEGVGQVGRKNNTNK